MMRIFFLLFALVFILTACQSKAAEVVGEKVNVEGGAYYNINADELDSLLKKKDFVFVNVHIHLKGTSQTQICPFPMIRSLNQPILRNCPLIRMRKSCFTVAVVV
jgi:hypothetical protein